MSGENIHKAYDKLKSTKEGQEFLTNKWLRISNTIKDSWNTYHSNLSDQISYKWKDPNSGYNTRSFRDQLHWILLNRWNDPNDTFNSTDWRIKKSAIHSGVMCRRWADPEDTLNSSEYRKVLSDRLKYVWNHPDEYPYFHEVMQKMAENGGLFGYLQRHPEITTCRGGLYYQGYYQSIKGGNCRYMSSYELKLIKDLDNDPEVLSFVTQPLGIKYYRPGDEKSHRYYPDFLVTFIDGHKLLIEVKPEIFLDTELNQLKFAIGEKYAHDQGWDWAVFTEAELGI